MDGESQLRVGRVKKSCIMGYGWNEELREGQWGRIRDFSSTCTPGNEGYAGDRDGSGGVGGVGEINRGNE